MKILKFETHKKITDFCKMVDWKAFLKIFAIPFLVLIIPELIGTSDENEVSIWFSLLLILCVMFILLLNAYFQFIIINKHKKQFLSNKEKRKLKLEKLKYESGRNLQRIKLRLF